MAKLSNLLLSKKSFHLLSKLISHYDVVMSKVDVNKFFYGQATFYKMQVQFESFTI